MLEGCTYGGMGVGGGRAISILIIAQHYTTIPQAFIAILPIPADSILPWTHDHTLFRTTLSYMEFIPLYLPLYKLIQLFWVFQIAPHTKW